METSLHRCEQPILSRRWTPRRSRCRAARAPFRSRRRILAAAFSSSLSLSISADEAGFSAALPGHEAPGNEGAGCVGRATSVGEKDQSVEWERQAANAFSEAAARDFDSLAFPQVPIPTGLALASTTPCGVTNRGQLCALRGVIIVCFLSDRSSRKIGLQEIFQLGVGALPRAGCAGRA
jgi:hypothetical protein